MQIVGKTLWLIESNLSGPLTLADLARQVGVTQYHLARVFAETTGHPVMRYVWRRRLTRAAQALAHGEASVLTIALDAAYASPEPFTRAFRAEFGQTPSQFRAGGLDTTTLTHPIQPRTKMTSKLAPPRIDTMPTRRFAGPVRRYTMQTRSDIPAQWVAYNEADIRVTGAVPDDYYGLCFKFSEEEGSFDYMCGQEVPAGAALPAGFGSVTLSGRYARFATKGHISTMTLVWEEIYGHWLGQADLKPRPGPSVEYYPPAFDGMTGNGGFEIWIAVEG
jgi:AraC family transcriptional regulator